MCPVLGGVWGYLAYTARADTCKTAAGRARDYGGDSKNARQHWCIVPALPAVGYVQAWNPSGWRKPSEDLERTLEGPGDAPFADARATQIPVVPAS